MRNCFLTYFFKYKLYPVNSKSARKINSGKAVATKLNFKFPVFQKNRFLF